MRHSITSGLIAVILCLSAPAFAATVSGKITGPGAAALVDMEVRLWADDGKGFTIAQTVVSAADGTYSFAAVPAGTYKLDARMAPMIEGNYGDRWYDVAAPTANGYVGADADELVIADADVLTGMNITLEVLGGLDMRAMAGANPVQGLKVRAESKADARIHHNDTTQGPCCGTNPHLGRAFFRGMVPANYRFLIYDPTGVYRTVVASGPFTVTSGNDADAGNVTVSAMVVDPSEPNGTGAAAGTPTITMFPYAPTNASVAPRGDVDYYCLNGLAGERYKASVTSMLTVEGTERRHPWFDPMIGLSDGTSIVLSNDDVTPGQSWDAVLDTGALPSDGRWCFVVSTFGDAAFTGAGQLSVGEYQLEVGYGNRPPTFAVNYLGVPAPTPPMEILVDEDVPMTFELVFADPDGDMLGLQVRHFDNASMPVGTGVLTELVGTATYEWTPNQQDAMRSPFELTFRARDAEFDLRIPVIVRVGSVSVPPTVPVLVSPPDGTAVDTLDVTLTLANSTDADGDALTYDFQVEIGEPDAAPEFAATENEDASGMTSTLIAGLTENDLVNWRARAYDGGDYSAWSDWSQFVVDAQNDPPDAPTIIKPTSNERLEERQPTIASSVPSDPEGDALTVLIELARDEEFEDIVGTSGAVEPTTDMTMVSWLVPDLLDFGGRYYVRASATDVRGATSAFSEVVTFTIRFESELMPPSFSADFAQCEPVTLNALPAELRVLNVDNSGAVVTFEVELVSQESSETPLVVGTAPQSEAIETIVMLDITGIEAPAGAYLLRVRAVRDGDATGWTECPFSLAGGGGGGADENIEPDGCGCGTAGGAPGGFLLLAFVAVIRRSRRR